MTIKPWGKKIQLKIEEPKVGVLDTSSKPSAVEYAEVINVAFHKDINPDLIGKHIFFKAWAVDIITYNDEKYYFIDADSNGICAIVME